MKKFTLIKVAISLEKIRGAIGSRLAKIHANPSSYSTSRGDRMHWTKVQVQRISRNAMEASSRRLKDRFGEYNNPIKVFKSKKSREMHNYFKDIGEGLHKNYQELGGNQGL